MEREIRLGWLAGILEGEGSFQINKAGSKRKHFVYGIAITNSDLIILGKCKEILEENGISCSLYPGKIYYKHRKKIYNLVIRRIDDLVKLLTIILPYLIGQKKSQAKIMLDFLTRRKYLTEANKNFSPRQIAYDDVDNAYFKSLKALMHNPAPVETITLSTHTKIAKTCQIENCNAKYYAKGYCQEHYEKLVKYPKDKLREALMGKDRVRAGKQLPELAEMTNRLN